MRRYEDTLLGESIDDDQNSGESEGLRKLLDEVHGDGVPGLLGDRELLESSVWLGPGRLGSLTSRAGLAIVLDKPADSRPRILASDELQRLVKAIMIRERMIMLVTENAESEIGVVGDVNVIIEEE